MNVYCHRILLWISYSKLTILLVKFINLDINNRALTEFNSVKLNITLLIIEMSTSKYPLVILFRHNNYSQIDNFIENNRESLMCSIQITNDINELNKLYNPY